MKLIKVLLFVFLSAIILIALAAAFVKFSPIPSYEPEEVDLKVQAIPAKVQHGAKLASMLCNHCHRSSKNEQLTGRLVEDMDPVFGTVRSNNITQDKEKGIGKWSDGQLAYFIRTGVRPDGTYAPPYMPKLPLMAHDDVEAIIAFLRSDHPSVQASKEEPPPSEPSFLTKMLCRVAFKPYPYPDERIIRPSLGDKVEYGKYLANAALGCFQCHSADFKTNLELTPEASPGFMGGGNRLYDMEGNVLYSANLTMDKETGLGGWTEDQFVRAVKYCKLPDGRVMEYPMIPYVNLEDEEIKAIWAYLKTIPEINNRVERTRAKAASARPQ